MEVQAPMSSHPLSNRRCGFPAYGSRTGFTGGSRPASIAGNVPDGTVQPEQVTKNQARELSTCPSFSWAHKEAIVKLSIKIMLMSVIGFLMVLPVNAESVCDRPLVAGWNGYWPPFTLGTPLEPSGLSLEILAEMMKRVGCQLKFTETEHPWKRQLNLLEHGNLDLLYGATETEERSKYAYFTEPYRNEFVTLFVRKGEVGKYNINKVEDFITENIRIGVERGVSYGPRVNAVIKEMEKKAEYISDIKQNRAKLLAKRFYGYLGFLPDEPLALLDDELNDKIEPHPMEIAISGNIRFMLSKKSTSKELATQLNEALDGMKNDGTYEKIVKKYSDKYKISQW